jgi:hypothetical protein
MHKLSVMVIIVVMVMIMVIVMIDDHRPVPVRMVPVNPNAAGGSEQDEPRQN